MFKNKFFYILLFFVLGIYSYKSLIFNNYIIKEIIIENQSTRSSMQVIKNKLQYTLEKPLNDLNLRNIKETIESIDWIKRAQISFDRPNILKIKFDEYNPAYIYNEQYYVDHDGSVFVSSGVLLNILKLSSNNMPHNSMYELYKSIKLMLDSTNQNITAISNNSDMLNIKLDNMAINVRYSNHEKKLEEFINVYPKLIEIYNEKYIKIDMRYSTGFAVE
tara:strand:- start:262 stop:918 length:657 start_codon:yes stop_codon:yes gene_type:complete